MDCGPCELVLIQSKRVREKSFTKPSGSDPESVKAFALSQRRFFLPKQGMSFLVSAGLQGKEISNP